MSLMSLAGVGFLLGLRHASDADHVVAVATIITHERAVRAAAMTGLYWGIGHTLTITLLGMLLVLSATLIPPVVASAAEAMVGVMLIGLGAWALWSGCGVRGAMHDTRGPGRDEAHARRAPFTHALRPLSIGALHGVAGSASIALLIAATVHDTWTAVLYLLAFGGGSVLGMVCLSAAMAAPLAFVSARRPQVARWLCTACASASVGLGALLLISFAAKTT